MRRERLRAEGFSADREPSLEDGDFRFASTATRGWDQRLFAERSSACATVFATAGGGIRVDGSTAFGDDLALQVYPAIGASYVISDEPLVAGLGGASSCAPLRECWPRADRLDELRTWRESDFDGETAFVPASGSDPDLAPERTSETSWAL